MNSSWREGRPTVLSSGILTAEGHFVGVLFLAILVLASLVFSVRAWRSYDSLSRRESDGPTDRPVLVISIAAIVLYSFVLELLAHYTKLSFIARIGVTGAAILLV